MALINGNNEYNPITGSLQHPSPAAVGSASTLNGDGPPPADLGAPGNTYTDNLDGSLYWKDVNGWHP